tara:strand:- start:601 stop:714 length:114 start_codon:yes stop_codon:yes gene_type:complete
MEWKSQNGLACSSSRRAITTKKETLYREDKEEYMGVI